jgi:hypothetical protein
MDQQMMKRPIVIGRVARAEVCPCARSVVLSVGAMSLRLEVAAAEDVAMTLIQALGLIEGGGIATIAPANVVDGQAEGSN